MTATKEKEINIEITEKEMEKIQELWRDVESFEQVLDNRDIILISMNTVKLRAGVRCRK